MSFSYKWYLIINLNGIIDIVDIKGDGMISSRKLKSLLKEFHLRFKGTRIHFKDQINRTIIVPDIRHSSSEEDSISSDEADEENKISESDES
jgi:hypothetical protein